MCCSFFPFTVYKHICLSELLSDTSRLLFVAQSIVVPNIFYHVPVYLVMHTLWSIKIFTFGDYFLPEIGLND